MAGGKSVHKPGKFPSHHAAGLPKGWLCSGRVLAEKYLLGEIMPNGWGWETFGHDPFEPVLVGMKLEST